MNKKKNNKNKNKKRLSLNNIEPLKSEINKPVESKKIENDQVNKNGNTYKAIEENVEILKNIGVSQVELDLAQKGEENKNTQENQNNPDEKTESKEIINLISNDHVFKNIENELKDNKTEPSYEEKFEENQQVDSNTGIDHLDSHNVEKFVEEVKENIIYEIKENLDIIENSRTEIENTIEGKNLIKEDNRKPDIDVKLIGEEKGNYQEILVDSSNEEGLKNAEEAKQVVENPIIEKFEKENIGIEESVITKHEIIDDSKPVDNNIIEDEPKLEFAENEKVENVILEKNHLEEENKQSVDNKLDKEEKQLEVEKDSIEQGISNENKVMDVKVEEIEPVENFDTQIQVDEAKKETNNPDLLQEINVDEVKETQEPEVKNIEALKFQEDGETIQIKEVIETFLVEIPKHTEEKLIDEHKPVESVVVNQETTVVNDPEKTVQEVIEAGEIIKVAEVVEYKKGGVIIKERVLDSDDDDKSEHVEEKIQQRVIAKKISLVNYGRSDTKFPTLIKKQELPLEEEIFCDGDSVSSFSEYSDSEAEEEVKKIVLKVKVSGKNAEEAKQVVENPIIEKLEKENIGIEESVITKHEIIDDSKPVDNNIIEDEPKLEFAENEKVENVILEEENNRSVDNKLDQEINEANEETNNPDLLQEINVDEVKETQEPEVKNIEELKFQEDGETIQIKEVIETFLVEIPKQTEEKLIDEHKPVESVVVNQETTVVNDPEKTVQEVIEAGEIIKVAEVVEYKKGEVLIKERVLDSDDDDKSENEVERNAQRVVTKKISLVNYGRNDLKFPTSIKKEDKISSDDGESSPSEYSDSEEEEVKKIVLKVRVSAPEKSAKRFSEIPNNYSEQISLGADQIRLIDEINIDREKDYNLDEIRKRNNYNTEPPLPKTRSGICTKCIIY